MTCDHPCQNNGWPSRNVRLLRLLQSQWLPWWIFGDDPHRYYRKTKMPYSFWQTSCPDTLTHLQWCAFGHHAGLLSQGTPYRPARTSQRAASILPSPKAQKEQRKALCLQKARWFCWFRASKETGEMCPERRLTCRSTETGGRTVTRSTRASAGSGAARQPTSGAADSTAPPEVAQCEESVKLTDRLLLALTPSKPASHVR